MCVVWLAKWLQCSWRLQCRAPADDTPASSGIAPHPPPAPPDPLISRCSPGGTVCNKWTRRMHNVDMSYLRKINLRAIMDLHELAWSSNFVYIDSLRMVIVFIAWPVWLRMLPVRGDDAVLITWRFMVWWLSGWRCCTHSSHDSLCSGDCQAGGGAALISWLSLQW